MNDQDILTAIKEAITDSLTYRGELMDSEPQNYEPNDFGEFRTKYEAIKAALDRLKLQPIPEHPEYVKAAQRLYESEGTLEIDDNAVVSMGDDPGAYVAAWVWVYADQITEGDSRA